MYKFILLTNMLTPTSPELLVNCNEIVGIIQDKDKSSVIFFKKEGDLRAYSKESPAQIKKSCEEAK